MIDRMAEDMAGQTGVRRQTQGVRGWQAGRPAPRGLTRAAPSPDCKRSNSVRRWFQAPKPPPRRNSTQRQRPYHRWAGGQIENGGRP